MGSLTIAVSGMLSLAWAMGIGRFVYTSIVPSTVDAPSLSKFDAGLIFNAACALSPERQQHWLAIMASEFGTGQIVGPIIADWLIDVLTASQFLHSRWSDRNSGCARIAT